MHPPEFTSNSRLPLLTFVCALLPLQRLYSKGCDASNVYDEEVPDDVRGSLCFRL